jgi:hypothetical protein
MNNTEQNSSDKKQVGQAYNWLSDHGQISFNDLKELAQAETPEAAERLYELADDNNIPYDQTTDLMQLAKEINSALETDANTGVE